jgi:acetate---CoA ligase (ADP-forming)
VEMTEPVIGAESAQSVIRRGAVGALLRPSSVAVIGASANATKIGGLIVRLLTRHGFRGPVYPVNPKYDQVGGLRCYPDLDAIPADKPIDTAIVYVSAAHVADVVRQCGQHGVKSLVIISSGFAELSEPGKALQADLVRTVREYGMAMSGPNCAGIANFSHDYVAYGTTNFIELERIIKGGVALLTASGGFGNTVFTYCQERALGLSHIIGLGNEALTNAAEFLDVLVDDPAVSIIVANLEAVRDPASFFRAADRAVDRGKPVIVMKAGRSVAGRYAIATHTAALGGSAEAYAGAFKQHGVVQVTDLDQLADTAMLMSRGAKIAGDRVGILSLAGGGTGLLCDIAADHGFRVPDLEATTAGALSGILPPLAVVRNPLDPTAGFARDGERLRAALATFAADPNIDVVVFFPLASQISYAEHLASTLIAARQEIEKPLIVIWTAGQTLADNAWRMLHEAEVALFTNSADAFRAMRRARQYHDFIRDLGCPEAADFGAFAGTSLETTSNMRRTDWLQALKRFGIRFPASRLSHSAEEAAAAVESLGRCALKISSDGIAHKTEAGGVRLDVSTGTEARVAYDQIMASCRQYAPRSTLNGVEVQQMAEPGLEVLLGIRTDDQLGPILTVGLGGVFTELLRDVAQRPVPISRLDAQAMLEELRAGSILDGFRDRLPADKESLIDAMLGLSAFAEAARARSPEVEVNPLVVHEAGRGSTAVDLVVQMTAPADA